MASHQHHLIPDHSLLQKRNLRPISSLSPFLPPCKPLATTGLLSASIDLPNLDNTYNWNYTTCGSWCLTSFT